MPTPKDEVPVPAPSGAQPRAARKPKGKGKGNGDEKQEGAKERAAAERLETSLANAQKALDQLAEVNANVLWRGIVRSNELDRRTSKASTCERDMQRIVANDKASAEQKGKAEVLQRQLPAYSDRVSAMKQVFTIARSSVTDGLDHQITNSADFYNHIDKCAEILWCDYPTVMDMVHVIAKKIVEEPRLQLASRNSEARGFGLFFLGPRSRISSSGSFSP